MTPKSFFDSFFANSSIKKLLSKNSIVKLKHFEYDEYFEAKVETVEDEEIKITIDDVIDRERFNVNDKVVLSFVKSNKVFWADGEIISIKFRSPVEIILMIKDVRKRDDMRKRSRYLVSLSGIIKNEAEDTGKAIIVRDLSFEGLRVDCSSEFEVDSKVYISINLDKRQRCSFKGRVVRKANLGKTFEYGIQICNILRENNIVLYDYINKLENAMV
ncbi:PilZ domain-containing protein [Acetivibrio clariflavus]|uniref:PilZ domain-containing protein n=1 Tax=Acetivibrio clariflavus TaxID=288965 RepID=UPI000485C8D9|nr:PilZ domain-containing protein [Acetivibrio clariflavus]